MKTSTSVVTAKPILDRSYAGQHAIVCQHPECSPNQGGGQVISVQVGPLVAQALRAHRLTHGEADE
ncbi:MAG: hypothetical protein QOH56_857 [Pseudonocardiales bacterium]|jgi:hypothetical protein|nr:hypothetical protein [Pseudonocardiales bacterium]